MEDLIKKLTEAYGPSGDEGEICSIISELVKNKADQLFTDTMGNLFVIKEGVGPKIIISAHMDEIGIIVTHVDENGFLRIAPVGGLRPDLLIGQRVRFKDGAGGTIYHEKIKDRKELDWNKIYLDLGFNAGKDVPYKVGDQACIDKSFTRAAGGRYIAKAMDNRSGCAVLIETINRLPQSFNKNVCFLFSVQEELGLRGAKTAAYRYQPDYGLAVDVTAVGDTPKAPTNAVSLGKGPAIKVKDRSVITHPLVRSFMIKTAEEKKIPYQLEVLEHGGTDTGAIHLSREGVPSGAISIPCRYVHTASEMVDPTDLSLAVDLLYELINAEWPSAES